MPFNKKIMINYWFNLTIFFNLITLSLFSNTTEGKRFIGRVIEDSKEEKIPIWPTKIILINHSDTIFVEGTVTGLFEISNFKAGLYKINIKADGYRTLDSTMLIVPSEEELIIKLKSDTSKLNQVLYPLNGGYDRKLALLNIKNNQISLLIPGGFINPKIYPADTIFENNYKLKYENTGCVQFNVLEYNETVFEYLDKLYGEEWRKNVRQDVVGLKK